MAGPDGRRFRAGPNFVVQLHNAEFVKLRKVAPLEAMFEAMGTEWVADLNSELHKAQRARRQPVRDGYKHYVNQGRTRVRLYVLTATARAMAHEKKHSSILKLMKTSRHDVKLHAELTAAQSAASRGAAGEAGLA